MTYAQCTELEATKDIVSFEGRSMRRFTKGQIVWVTNSRDEQSRLGIVALARKGKNATTAQYWKIGDVIENFREI